MKKMKKIRLYRGPLNGKVFDHRDAGADTIVIRAHKPMSRRERYGYDRERFMNTAAFDPTRFQYPVITERYNLVMRPVDTENGNIVAVPLYHPDGSLFYEWANPRRK